MDLLTVQETAELLKVNPITVRRYIAAGTLPAVKVGKRVRVRKEAVEKLVTPIEPKASVPTSRPPLGRPLSYEDALWKLIGSATDAEPTDAAEKHEYLAEAKTQPSP